MRTRSGWTYGVVVLCATVLVSCGGGGGGDGTNPSSQQPDSSFDPTSTGLYQETVTPSQRLGQTFVAHTTGTLQMVDLLIAQSGAGPMTVSITPTVLGLPDNNDGASLGGVVAFDGTFTSSLQWQTIQLATENIQVVSGQAYAICLSAGGRYDWASSGAGFPDRFPDGQGCGRNDPGDWWSAHPEDFAFRVWIDP